MSTNQNAHNGLALALRVGLAIATLTIAAGSALAEGADAPADNARIDEDPPSPSLVVGETSSVCTMSSGRFVTGREQAVLQVTAIKTLPNGFTVVTCTRVRLGIPGSLTDPHCKDPSFYQTFGCDVVTD